jgi:hypothetical protein
MVVTAEPLPVKTPTEALLARIALKATVPASLMDVWLEKP